MNKRFIPLLLLAAAMPAWVYGQAEAADRIEPPQGMHLVWHDEFDYAGRPDSSKWDFEHGFVRNQELQWYQPQNAVVADGVLRISALREQVPNPRYRAGSNNWKHNREYAEYTSSCLRTMRHFTYKYGRLEVRAKIPVAPGAWPAIWTLGNRGGWPGGGEVDVMEFYRVPPSSMGIHHTTGEQGRTFPIILANACWQGANGRDAWNTKRIPFTHFTEKDEHWADKFHVWRMDWDEEHIRLYLDDELLNTIPTKQADPQRPGNFNPFANDLPGFGHYILLNLAIGSSGGTPDDSAFPMVYEIDYVRVFQK